MHPVKALSGIDVNVLSSTARPEGPESARQLYVGEEVGGNVVGDMLVGALVGSIGDTDVGIRVGCFVVGDKVVGASVGADGATLTGASDVGCVVGAVGAVDVGVVLGWTVGTDVAVVGAHVPLLATQLQIVVPVTYNDELHAHPLKAASLLLTLSIRSRIGYDNAGKIRARTKG